MLEKMRLENEIKEGISEHEDALDKMTGEYLEKAFSEALLCLKDRGDNHLYDEYKKKVEEIYLNNTQSEEAQDLFDEIRWHTKYYKRYEGMGFHKKEDKNVSTKEERGKSKLDSNRITYRVYTIPKGENREEWFQDVSDGKIESEEDTEMKAEYEEKNKKTCESINEGMPFSISISGMEGKKSKIISSEYFPGDSSPGSAYYALVELKDGQRMPLPVLEKAMGEYLDEQAFVKKITKKEGAWENGIGYSRADVEGWFKERFGEQFLGIEENYSGL